MKTKVCRYFKFGYCKYGDKCHFRHINVICVNDKCEVFECEKIHPIACKYFGSFRKCKYTDCAYKHEEPSDMKVYDEKIKNIENKMKDQQPNTKNIEKKMGAFEKDCDKKFEALEHQLKKMSKLIDEKNERISSFEVHLEDIKDKLAKQETENATLKLRIKALETNGKEMSKDNVLTLTSRQLPVKD